MRVRAVPGLGAAAVLAAVTLAVFGTFQNYGPESAVRRFHHAVATNNRRELAQVVDTPDASAVAQLAEFVDLAVHGSPNFRVVTSERTDGEVKMIAFYANGASAVWVVDRGRDRWRINSFLTLQSLRKILAR